MKERQIISTGDSSIFISLGEVISPEISRDVTDIATYIDRQSLPGIEEIIPSYCGVTVIFNPLIISREELENTINKPVEANSSERSITQLTIPVIYGGIYGYDLPVVADHNKMGEAEVIRIHSGAKYLVYMLGFTPGFPYLGGLPHSIATPRRKEPRLEVAGGSIGIAGNQTGIYPVTSPGGWQIIGRTPVKLFDPYSASPYLISPGMEIRFRPVEIDEFNDIENSVQQSAYKPETELIKK